MKIARPFPSLALAALALAAAFLPSCSRQEVSLPTPVKTPANVLRLYTWSEYFDPDVLALFEEKTGIRVEYLTFSDFDEMEAQLRSRPGYYDVVVTDDSAIQALWELHLIQKFDRDQLPNLANIHPDYLGLYFDPENAFSVPYMWGTTLVAYRADRIEDPEQSWNLLWDERYQGKIMTLQDRLGALSVALLTLGYSMNSENPDEINEAAEKCVQQVKRVDVRYGDDAAVREALDEGTVWAAMCYSGDAAMVAAENENVAFFIPKEGAPLWVDNFVISRDSKHSEEAHRFINFMLEPEIAAANSNYTYYASPNQAAKSLLDPELLADESINPPDEIRKRCSVLAEITELREELANRAWLKVLKAVQKKGQLSETLTREIQYFEATAETEF